MLLCHSSKADAAATAADGTSWVWGFGAGLGSFGCAHRAAASCAIKYAILYHNEPPGTYLVGCPGYHGQDTQDRLTPPDPSVACFYFVALMP